MLAVAGLAAIATTKGSVHVAPDRLVLGAAAAVLTAALLAPERRHRAAAIVAALVAGLAAAHLLVRPGMPQVHDPDHVWGLWAYARSVRSGHLLPMWMPWLGAGMPLLQFYGPVSFLSALPGIVLGLSPVGIWKLTLAQASVLTGFGALAGPRLAGASWRGAAVAACALAFAPWKLAVFHYRGALGEAVALALAPVLAGAAIAMWRAPSRRLAWGLGGVVALAVPTHLITLFCLGVVLVPVLVVEEIAARRAGRDAMPLLRRAGLLAIPVVLGAGAVAVWVVPALAESGTTTLPLQIRENSYFVYAQHGLTLQDVGERRLWDRSRPSLLRRARAAGGEGQQMPFYVGSVLLIAGLSAPWWSRSRTTWCPACGAAAAVLCALAPVADVMTRLPLVDAVQFPWRFLSTAAVFASLAVGAGVTALLGPAPSWKRALPRARASRAPRGRCGAVHRGVELDPALPRGHALGAEPRRRSDRAVRSRVARRPRPDRDGGGDGPRRRSPAAARHDRDPARARVARVRRVDDAPVLPRPPARARAGGVRGSVGAVALRRGARRADRDPGEAVRDDRGRGCRVPRGHLHARPPAGSRYIRARPRAGAGSSSASRRSPAGGRASTGRGPRSAPGRSAS